MRASTLVQAALVTVQDRKPPLMVSVRDERAANGVAHAFGFPPAATMDTQAVMHRLNRSEPGLPTLAILVVIDVAGVATSPLANMLTSNY